MSFEEIIPQVRRHPEIWQISHPLYHNKSLRKKLWRQIAKELQADENLIKKRWKNLMDQFRKEFKKIENQTLPDGEPLGSGWVHYDSLTFLQEEMALRKGRVQTRTGSESDQDQDEDSRKDNYENIVWTYSLDNEPPAKKPAPDVPATTGTSTGISKADLILQRLQTLSTFLAKTSQKDDAKKDEDYHFFMSVLPMVRNLSAVKKLQFRMKVNEWLLQVMTPEGGDPLNNTAQYTMEDSKESVMKQLLDNEDE